MEERFQELLEHIDDPAVNTTGVVGEWIKATEHNTKYDNDHPGHPDRKGGWNWWKYSNEQAGIGRICKYKVGKFVYWVKPESQAQFEVNYPIAENLFP